MNRLNVKLFLSFSVILLVIVFYVGTGYMTLATFNYLLILAGFLMRKKNRVIHVRFISLGILLDLFLVVLLELQRDAVATAMSFELSIWNQAHIFSSLLATLFYIPMVITGVMILKWEKAKKWHPKFGYMTIIFRTLGFIFMFSMIK